jgi:hypothetical protein
MKTQFNPPLALPFLFNTVQTQTQDAFLMGKGRQNIIIIGFFKTEIK